MADVLRLRKTMKNHWLQAVSQLTKKVIKIPYKTCRFRSLFWSLTQKGSQNPYKTCRILIQISGLAKNEKRKIPVALRSFWSTRFFVKNPYKNLSFMKTFWSFSQNGLKKYQTSIRFSLKMSRAVCNNKNQTSETLIKPVVYEDF